MRLTAIGFIVAIVLAASGCTLFSSTSEVALDESDVGVQLEDIGGEGLDVGPDSSMVADDVATPDDVTDPTDVAADIGGDDVRAEDVGPLDAGPDMSGQYVPIDCPASPAPPNGTDHVVGSGTAATCTEAALREAVEAGGVIRFDCGAANVMIAVSDDLEVTNDVTIIGEGLVTLSGGGTTRIFSIFVDGANENPHLQLFGVNLVDGFERLGNSDGDCGAAVYRFGGTLTIVDSELSGNRCEAVQQGVPFGGAIVGLRGGGTFIFDSVMEGNEATGGGAVYTSNTEVQIVRTEIRDNVANVRAGGGLALFEQGPIEICGSILENNFAERWGGGIFYDDDNLPPTTISIRYSHFFGNNALEDGGAADLEDTVVLIEGSSFQENLADSGGALWFGRNEVEIENSTFLGNVASTTGGGIYLESSMGSLEHLTLSGNSAAATGTGAAIANTIPSGTLSLDNSIVADNTGPTDCNAELAGANNLEHPDQYCSAGSTTDDPQLGAVEALPNGTVVAVPPADSPAVGLAKDCSRTDQSGFLRPEPCAAGAMEPVP